MRFVTTPSPFAPLVAAAALLMASSSCEAFTNPGTPLSPPGGAATASTEADTRANDAMSQYEAALKAAFEQASASAVPSTINQQQELQPQVEPPHQQQGVSTEARIEANTALLEQVQQQEHAIDQYEAALKAALESSSSSSSTMENSAAVVAAPPAIVFGQQEQQEQQHQHLSEPDLDSLSRDIASRIERAESANGGQPLDATARAELTGSVIVGSATSAAAAASAQQQQQQHPEPDWDGISRDITSRIEKAESANGGRPLDPTATAEIVGTVIAGSATAAAAATVGSPLLIGAALGVAGTHVLGGKRGEALAEATKTSFREALEFTQASLAAEEGDVSRASAKIAERVREDTQKHVEHLREEAIQNAREVTHFAQVQAHQVSREISNAPSHLVEETKKMIVGNKDVPQRTFRAVRTFLGSEEVQRAKDRVVQSIKDGLESEELRAVKSRASRSLKEL